MARVKRAVNAHKKRRVILERAEGYRGQRSRLYRKAKEQVTHSLVYCVQRPSREEGRLPSPLDPAHQRRVARERPDVQPPHPGPRPCRRRGRPSHPRRPRGQRARHVHGARRDRQEGTARPTRRPRRPPRKQPLRVQRPDTLCGVGPLLSSRPVVGPPIDLRHAREPPLASRPCRCQARQQGRACRHRVVPPRRAAGGLRGAHVPTRARARAVRHSDRARAAPRDRRCGGRRRPRHRVRQRARARRDGRHGDAAGIRRGLPPVPDRRERHLQVITEARSDPRRGA